MIGMSSSNKEHISNLVDSLFDRIAYDFLGNIPKLKDKKSLIIASKRSLGLPNLFVQAMRNKNPNEIEKDVLKNLLDTAYGYIDSLKGRTRSNITERIDGLIKESKIKGISVSESQIHEIMDEEMSKAKNQLQAIVEAESTKSRNVGTMMDISRVAADIGDLDPTVFFVVVKDGKTCNECKRLHLMPDETTPRLWKFSELKQGYHKRSENSPSAFGLHPHCRCTLTYLSPGFGFDSFGKLDYKSESFDAFSAQRSKK